MQALQSAMENNLLDSLNPEQRQAVETIDGPVLVLAGAGTGKTRVLTTRLANIIMSARAWPNEVLAVTFTNKAAQEMKNRIATMINRSIEGLWLGTFHSLCVRILRKHAEYVGLKTNFTILDQDDQLRLIKAISKSYEIDDKQWPPRLILSVINRWKDRALKPEKVSQEEIPTFSKDKGQNPCLNIYKEYQSRLQVLNAADFGDLIMLCLELFKNNPDILDKYQQQFKYIMVDEYQDSNVAQYLWMRLLAQKHGNICCVGDDDQSIYGWRGAEVTNILRFDKDFPGAQIIRLEQNYRSTEHILGAASSLIAQNQGRLGKTLWTQSDGGEKVKICSLWDSVEEARIIGEEIEALQRKKVKLGNIAILVRASFQTREFEERFMKISVPYKVIGGARFYERQEIRDALAYLRIVAQSSDSLALERIINLPKRGIGASSLQVIHQQARFEQIPLFEAAGKIVETDEIRGKARSSLIQLLNDIKRWHDRSEGMKTDELAKMILDESGYTSMWLADKSPDAAGRLENLKEFVSAIGEFETLQGFLEHVSLVMDSNSQNASDSVSIMTLHSAKGLEFDFVYLPGWEENLFPHQKSLNESGNKGLEEERRLAYVGITRAKQQSTITYAASRKVHGQWQHSPPSRFLNELSKDHIEHTHQTGLYGDTVASDKYSSTRKPNAGSNVEYLPTKKSTYSIGQKVFHQKFGYGYINGIDGDKLEINFQHAGSKRVLSNFVSAT